MSEPEAFLFTDVGRGRECNGLVACVPHGIRGKRELLEVLARQLSFPDYFGFNWDALEECLRDLSWLSERRIVILHESLPLRDEKQRRIYVQILQDAMASWNSGDAHELVAIFPASSRAWVTTALKGELNS